MVRMRVESGKPVGATKLFSLHFPVLAIFCLVLSACSSVRGIVAQNTGSSVEGLPGSEEFGLTKAELVTSIESVETLIEECMQEAGFEYIAVDYSTVRRGMVADKSYPGLSEREFHIQYGFGISTLYTGQSPQLAADTTPAKIGLGEHNAQIFKNLSTADQAAYNQTLLGENHDATFAVTLEFEDFSRTGGCTRSAIEQVFSPEQLTASYINPLDAMIFDDPRMIEGLVDYAACMQEAGFNYTHPEDIEPDFRTRLDEITAGLPVEALSPESKTALEKLQTEERAVAIVAFDCEVNILDPIEDKIERELYTNPPK